MVLHAQISLFCIWNLFIDTTYESRYFVPQLCHIIPRSYFSICVQYFLPLFNDQDFIIYFQVDIQISIDNEGRTLVFSFVKSFFLCMSKGRPDLTNFSKGMKPSPTQSWASDHFPNPSLKTLIWPRLPNMTLKVVGLWIWPMLSVLPIWAKFFRSKQTNFFTNGIEVQDTKFFNYI